MTSPDGLRAGAGRATIRIPVDAHPLDGFVGEHDPLRVRALLLNQRGTRVLLLSVDQTSMADDIIAAIKDVASGETGLDGAHILVAATHTFSAPHLSAEDDSPASKRYLHAVLTAVAAATSAAVAAEDDAVMSGGIGTHDVGASRDVLTPHGWWVGINENTGVDRCLQVVRIETRDGEPIAVIVCHATPPAVMKDSRAEDGSRLISADLAGATMDAVEAALPGAVAIFLLGTAGDQTPALVSARSAVDAAGNPIHHDLGRAGFALVPLLAERLTADILKTYGSAHEARTDSGIRISRFEATVPGQDPTPFTELRPQLLLADASAPAREAPAVILSIGDITLIGVQAELSAATGVALRAASPFPITLVATMIDGAAKYMAEGDAYERVTYAAMNSRFGRGAAEMFEALISSELRALHDAGSTSATEQDAS